MTTYIDATYCPLCQQNNRCDVDSPQGCWCTSEKVSNALIKQVPDEQQGKSCICQVCIQKFNLAKDDNFTSL